MRRHVLQPLIALALAALFAAPVAAVEPGGASRETLTGTLDALYVETFQEAHPRPRFELRTKTGSIPVAFADGSPEDLAGAKVKLTGRRSREEARGRERSPRPRLRGPRERAGGDVLDAGASAHDGGGGTFSTAATTHQEPRDRPDQLQGQHLAPFAKTAVQSALTGSATSIKAFFEEESKSPLVRDRDRLRLVHDRHASTTCDWNTWTTYGANAVTAAGGSLSGLHERPVRRPQHELVRLGRRAYVNGTKSVLNGNISVQVMTHELGHNFGLGHANALYCTSSGGTRVSIDTTVELHVQGLQDPFSTMGNNALRHNHGSMLGELGFLGASEKVVGAPGNTYTIAPWLGSGPVKLVRIPRGDGTFFDLDFRTPYGNFDNFTAGSPATVGVTIRLAVGTASPTSSPKDTNLIDTTPVDERPQGRPAPRREDAQGSGVRHLVQDAVVGRSGVKVRSRR